MISSDLSLPQEERDQHYGRVFSILVLARANRFAPEQGEKDVEMADSSEEEKDEEEDVEATKDSGSDEESGEEVDASEDEDMEEGDEERYTNPLDWAVSNLQDLSTRKEQYEQLCYYTMGEIFLQLGQETVEQVLAAVQTSLLPPSLEEYSASQLYFALLLENTFQVSSGSFGSSDRL